MVMLQPRVTSSASALGMLSPTGRCRPFDVAADGFVRSEGCAVVLLKRLPDALRDGDRILAVVRGTAANQDGRTATISTPSLDAQVAVYRAALAAAGVDADTVGVVEAHGTGTPVGDPIEFGSLSRVYGTAGKRCALGSVKSNVGHTESAAGTVGLIKAILVAPARRGARRWCTSPGCPTSSRRIETGLFVPQAITPWPSRPTRRHDGRRCRRTACPERTCTPIVEQAPETVRTSDASADVRGGSAAVPAVGHLGRGVARRPRGGWPTGWTTMPTDRDATGSGVHLGASARAPPGAHSGDRREPGRAGRGVARQSPRVDTPYPPAVGQDDRGPVWVFSGQGSQWAAMGAELLAREPVFAAVCRRGGAVDRPRSRVLGDRGDVGAGDGDRHRPGPAGPVHHAGRAGRRDAVLWGASGRGHRPFAGRGRGRRRRGSAVAGRRRARHLPPLAAVCRVAGAGAMASVELPAHEGA